MSQEDLGTLQLVDAWRHCVRTLLACAHACIAASDAWRLDATSPGRAARLHACNDAAGRCLAAHTSMGEHVDPTPELVECAEACRHAEAICLGLAEVHLPCRAASVACRRCTEACLDLAWRIRSERATATA